MSIDKFKAAISGGIARTNRYEVRIPFPRDTSSEFVSLMCDATNLPGLNIATTPSKMFGEIREVPYERMFDPIQLSFYVDAKFNIRSAFERWMHLIVNQNKRTFNYYDNYVRDVEILVYNVDEKQAPYTVTLYEAYPKTMSAVQLSADSREVMKLQVTMQYRYWKSNISGSTVPLAQLDRNPPPQDPQSTSTNSGFDGRTLMEIEYGIKPDGTT